MPTLRNFPDKWWLWWKCCLLGKDRAGIDLAWGRGGRSTIPGKQKRSQGERELKGALPMPRLVGVPEGSHGNWLFLICNFSARSQPSSNQSRIL